MNQNMSTSQASAQPAPLPDPAAEAFRRSALITSISVALVFFAMGAFGAWDALSSGAPMLQTYLTLAIVFLIALLAVRSILLNRHQYDLNAILVMLFGAMVGGILINLFTAGLGIILGGAVFALTVTSAARSLPSRLTNRFVLLGTASAVTAYLIDVAAGWPRDLASPEIILILSWILGVAILFFLVLLVRVYNQFPILAKMVVPFVIVSVAFVSALSAYHSATTRIALTESANQRLYIAAAQTAAAADAFYTSIASSLLAERTIDDLYRFLRLPAGEPERLAAEADADALLRSLQTRAGARSYTLLDNDGSPLLSTLVASPAEAAALALGQEMEQAAPGFLDGLEGVRVSPVMYAQDNQAVLYFAVPVQDLSGNKFGILVAEHSLERIQVDLMALSGGQAGQSSFITITDAEGLRIANSQAATDLDKLVSQKTIEEIQVLVSQRRLPLRTYGDLITYDAEYAAALQQAMDAGLEPAGGDSRQVYYFSAADPTSGVVNVAAMVRAASFPWFITSWQPQEALMAPIVQQTRQATLLGLLVAAAMIVASILIAQNLVRPIQTLTETAEQVARGNLAARARVRSEDEIGALATIFNTTTAQLRQTLLGLEQRVADRTQELAVKSAEAERRALQLSSIAEIARVLSQERDVDTLLTATTHEIASRFGFYHVGIFLIDRKGEFAVLRAANSEGGQKMLARNHRLRVGQEGIIGYVTAHAEPRIALDVGKDAVFFNNPDLPSTRSEMGIPLRSADRILGALDVQSTEPNAFTVDDLATAAILADQVASAIENARLFSETRQALEDLEAIQRLYLRQQWQRQVGETNRAGYLFDHGEVMPQPPSAAGLADSDSVLAAPISLRGEQIGAIELNDPLSQRAWSEEERSLALAVAQQVGLALENVRLLEETQRRAERETLVAQITSRLRASNDPQAILQTAVRELRSALQAQKAQILAPNQIETPEE
jgi:GAF domain-containing protein/HAMP domain-containing protein